MLFLRDYPRKYTPLTIFLLLKRLHSMWEKEERCMKTMSKKGGEYKFTNKSPTRLIQAQLERNVGSNFLQALFIFSKMVGLYVLYPKKTGVYFIYLYAFLWNDLQHQHYLFSGQISCPRPRNHNFFFIYNYLIYIPEKYHEVNIYVFIYWILLNYLRLGTLYTSLVKLMFTLSKKNYQSH